MEADTFIVKAAKTNPKKMLPTSPIKTFALGKLNGKKPAHDAVKIKLVKKT